MQIRYLRHRLLTLFLLIPFTGPILTGCAASQAVSEDQPSAGALPTRAWPAEDWPVAAPDEQGLDEAILNSLWPALEGRNLNVHSFLVIRNGYLVYEHYSQQYGPDRPHDLYSVTKSFIATLVGIAVEQGRITGVDQPIADFFPDQFPSDPQKKAITVEDLLTMTAGFQWDDDSSIGPLIGQADWIEYMLSLPMASPPGESFKYCSGCSHVLGAILQQAVGTGLQDYADENLLGPLGITGYSWQQDRQGLPVGGWGLRMTPRDMAKLGYLYLNDGRWEDRQLVPAEWVQAATQAHVQTGNKLDYGYQWWTYPKWNAYTARGRGGQLVLVIPTENLVIVTTADMQDDQPLFDLIEEFVVPAIH